MAASHIWREDKIFREIVPGGWGLLTCRSLRENQGSVPTPLRYCKGRDAGWVPELQRTGQDPRGRVSSAWGKNSYWWDWPPSKVVRLSSLKVYKQRRVLHSGKLS